MSADSASEEAIAAPAETVGSEHGALVIGRPSVPAEATDGQADASPGSSPAPDDAADEEGAVAASDASGDSVVEAEAAPGAASPSLEAPVPDGPADEADLLGAPEVPTAAPASEEVTATIDGVAPSAEAAAAEESAAAEPAAAESAPRPKRPLPRVMAVANQKGGVGKTTTSVNLGACLAELGHRTLVIDLDPQGNASTGLGINIRALESSMYDVILHDVPLEDCIEAASVRNLFVAPAALDLAGAEIELVPAFSREMRLKQAINTVRDDYDFILIDCPPSLGLLTVNGFAAADEVLVPIQCEYYALEGLGQLLRNVQLVQKNLNESLEMSTIVLVMYDARTKLADQVVKEVRAHFGDKVCRTIIPRTVRLSEAPSFGQPIVAFDPNSRGAIAYRELAKEVSGAS
jgi:chromosome partitioning protein